MDYALELFFDPASEARVRRYWEAVRLQTGNTYLESVGSRPHVTVGVFTDIDTGRACGLLREAAANLAVFPLRFQSVGVFTYPKAWVWLAPVVTAALLDLHASLHAAFAFCGGEASAYYRPGAWVPHCAVATTPDIGALGPAMQTLLQMFEPFTARAEEIAWVEIASPVRVIEMMRLLPGGEDAQPEPFQQKAGA